jgi:hypothetical protein
MHDFLDNLGAHQYEKMRRRNATKEEIINTCEETFGKECYEEYIQASYEVSPYYIDQTAEEVNQDINTIHDWYSAKEEAIREYHNQEET